MDTIVLALKVAGALLVPLSIVITIATRAINAKLNGFQKDIKADIVALRVAIQDWTRAHLDDKYVTKEGLEVQKLRIDHLEDWKTAQMARG